MTGDEPGSFVAVKRIWGGRSLVQASNCRDRYIAALQAADRRDYKPLFEFVRS